MPEVRAIVLRAAGINCDMETEYVLEQAGAKAQRVHINRIIEDKSRLDEFQIIVFPGGFSYGDDVAAGKILANQVVHHLNEPVRKSIDDGKLVLGICNGFQVLVKAGYFRGTGKNRPQPPVPAAGRAQRKTDYQKPAIKPLLSLTMTAASSRIDGCIWLLRPIGAFLLKRAGRSACR